jgi:hypothetical protein
MKSTDRKVARMLAMGLAGGLIVPAAADAGTHLARRRAGAAYASPGAGLAGVSSQKSGKIGLPVDVRASGTGRVMNRLDIQWVATCQGAGTSQTYSGLSVTVDRKLNTHGVFTNTATFTKSLSGGTKGVFTTKLYGRFISPNRVAGTLKVTVGLSDGSGATTATCDSGTISWRATN